MIPYDPRKPLDPSGIRVGTPAATTRGMGIEEMKTIARVMNAAIEHRDDESKLSELSKEIAALCAKFPIYR